MNKNILARLHNRFEQKGFCTLLEDDFLYIHHLMVTISVEKNIFNISFEVCCDPTTASIVTQNVIEFARKNAHKVDVYETYAHVLDENHLVQDILFGDEAIEYYTTGKIPVKIDEPKVDDEKKLNTILDQINAKGMKSLKKEQKQFLLDVSKGKTRC